MNKTLYLLRHGAVDEAFSGRCRGKTDCDLSEEGVRQSIENVGFLMQRKVQRVVTTGLIRTDYVGTALRGESDNTVAHHVDEGLQDPNFGIWEGKPWAEIHKEYPKIVAQLEDDVFNIAIPGGENFRDITERTLRSFFQHCSDLRESPEVDRIAIVSHMAIIGLILGDLENTHPKLRATPMASITQILVTNEGVEIVWKFRTLPFDPFDSPAEAGHP